MTAVRAAGAGSIRTRLLALALVPLLGVLPLLGLILLLWGNQAIDLLLSGRVRADLAVAQGYFDRVQAEVGSGTQAVASSHQLVRTLALAPPAERETALAALLARGEPPACCRPGVMTASARFSSLESVT